MDSDSFYKEKETDNPVGLSVSLAPQKEFESPTFRLGGGRSILLSYWGICIRIVMEKQSSVNLK